MTATDDDATRLHSPHNGHVNIARCTPRTRRCAQDARSFSGLGPRSTHQGTLARRKPVAEGAARRALHDGLGALEAHLARACRDDVEVGGADQQRAQLGFAQLAEEFGEAAARHVDVEHVLVLAQNLDLDLPAGDLAPDTLDGGPLAPRTALYALADGGEQLPRPVAQGLGHEGVGLVLSEFSPQRAHHRHQDLGLHPRLVEKRHLGINEVSVDHTHRLFSSVSNPRCGRRSP